jgi:hypothetical protein
MTHQGTVKKFYRFIQTPIFSMRLDATGEAGLLENIEGEISKNPKGGTLLKGGIRKIRVASSVRPEGKSGGFRIWYFYHESDLVYLLFLIDKRQAPDLTPSQEKFIIQELRQVLEEAIEGGK